MNEWRWRKFPGEKIAVGRDWTKDLDGASLVGEPSITVSSNTSLTCVYINTDGNISRFWLEGGDPRRNNQTVTLTVDTDEGEKLIDVILVDMLT